MFRVDAPETSDGPPRRRAVDRFFARELEEIDAQMYDVKYAISKRSSCAHAQALPGHRDVHLPPVRCACDRDHDQRTTRAVPRARTCPVWSSRARFARSGTPTATTCRRSARRPRPTGRWRTCAPSPLVAAINEKINRTALLGDARQRDRRPVQSAERADVHGPERGTGSSKLWTTKTAIEILDDLYGIVDQIPTTTAEVEKPTRLLMPYANLRFISRKRTGTGDGNLTVLQCFRENRPQVEVRGALFLDTAGAGGTVSRMVAYDPKPENLRAVAPDSVRVVPARAPGHGVRGREPRAHGRRREPLPARHVYGDGI
jgi:hypothetical protein